MKPTRTWHCSGGLERLDLDNLFRTWTDELMDVNLQHLDFGRGVTVKNQIIAASCEPGR